MIWIFVVAALAVSLFAFRLPATAAARLAGVAALVYLPFAMYLAANPATRWLGPAVWIIYVSAAVALYYGRRWLAAVLTAPAFVLAAYVALLITTYNPS